MVVATVLILSTEQSLLKLSRYHSISFRTKTTTGQITGSKGKRTTVKTVSTIRTRITTKITKTIVRSTRPPTTEIINSFDDEFERFVNVFSFP